MRVKSFFTALLAMCMVGFVASCQGVDEPPQPEPQPEPDPAPEAVVFDGTEMMGTYYEELNFFRLYFGKFDLGMGEPAWFTFQLRIEETYGLIPEGAYSFGENAPCIDKNDNNLGFYSAYGKKMLGVVDASMEVEHIGSEYHIVFNAEDENGKKYAFDWTGRLMSIEDDYPVYNPGEEPGEMPGDEPKYAEFRESMMRGYFYEDLDIYGLDFGYFEVGLNEPLMICMDLKIEDTKGVIPEGEYLFGDTAPCISNDLERTYFCYGSGIKVFDVVSASLVVEHVGNEYHLVFNAEDENGVRYEFDWTGRLTSIYEDFPLYHPGEEPLPELGECDTQVMRGNCVGGTMYELEFGLFYLSDGSAAMLNLQLRTEESNGVIPEGIYAIGDTAPCIDSNYDGFFFRSTGGEKLFDVEDATLTVGYVGNEYHLMLSAYNEAGNEFFFDWTGRLTSFDERSPIYHPGEAPEPEPEYGTFDGAVVAGYGYGDMFQLQMGFFNSKDYGSALVGFVLLTEGTNGVIPEGVYEIGESAPCIDSTYTHFNFHSAGGKKLFDVVEMSLEVEHVGNEYRFIINAKGSDGIDYSCDWTGRIRLYDDVHPIYHPGEAPVQ